MAFITFIAKNRDDAIFRLVGETSIGRSLDCQIYIPDIFLSRKHCTLENTPQGWRITDSRSKNGIFFNGKRFFRRHLQNGDMIELGTIAFEFNDGDIPELDSKPAPFGRGRPLTELMDTLFAEGLRAADYTLLKLRDPPWAARREGGVAIEIVPEVEEEPEPEYFTEWTEVDMEIHISNLPVPEPLRLCRVNDDGDPVAAEQRGQMEELLPVAPAEAPSPGTARGARWGSGSVAAKNNDDQMEEQLPANSRQAARGAGRMAAQRAAASGEGNGRRTREMPGGNGSEVSPTSPLRGWGKTKLFDDKDFALPEEPKSRKLPSRRGPGEAKAAEPSEPKAKRKAKIQIGPTFGERLQDWYDTLRATDLGELAEGARERPLFSAGIAASVLVLCSTWYWWSHRVVYHLPKDYLEHKAAYDNSGGD